MSDRKHGACPFCKVFSTTVRYELSEDRCAGEMVYYILCKECFGRGPIQTSPSAAWAAWNDGIDRSGNPIVSQDTR